jgi:cytochrome c554/c'-like protein
MGAFTLASAIPAAAQQYLGPSKCVQCHDHERQAQKWQKEEPAALKGKSHFSTLKQLDAPKASQWAKAIGLADPYDVKGACVKCHATVFRGDANAGVSCESCHGASSKYNDLHQQKGKYAEAVAAGLKDLKNKPPVIAGTCVECHVVPDKRLAAAGHPAGESFDAGASIQKIVHWKTAYNYAQIGAAGKSAAAGRAPAGTARPAPAAGGQGAAPAPAATAAGPAPAKPGASEPGKAAAPPAPAAPWDWDQPIRELPADYVPEPVPAEPAPSGSPARPAAPSAAPPPAPRRPRAEPAVPPSLAEETPLPRNLTPTLVPPAVPAPAAAASRTKAAEIAEARGRGAVLLDKLLRGGARVKDAPPPSRPLEFKGVDSELLRLQDEALALALEALRRPD